MLNRLEPQDQFAKAVDNRSAPGRDQSRSGIVIGLRAVAQIVLMLAVLAGSAVLMNRLIAAAPERTGRPNVDVALPVDAIIAQAADQRPVIRVFGQVTAAKSVDLRPSVGGEVVEVSSDLVSGRTVQQGQVLFSVDRFDYETALAEAQANLAQTRATIAENRATIVSEQEQLASAEEQLVFARDDLDRAEQLRTNGTVTQQQIDTRRLTVSQREQAVSQRRNNLAIQAARLDQQLAAEQRLELGVSRAQRDLQNTTVTAPFAGVVRSTGVEIGRIVTGNDVALSMYDADALDVEFTLTDAQYGRVATDGDPLIGRTVDVIWAVGEIDYDYQAVVERIGADIASDRGGVTVFARLLPDDQPVEIRPGAFVEARVPDRLYENAVRVPETALYNTSTVYVIAEGALERRDVQVAGFDGEDVILASGVANEERVLTTRLSSVEEGLSVTVPSLDGAASESSVERTGADAPPGSRGLRGARRGLTGG